MNRGYYYELRRAYNTVLTGIVYNGNNVVVYDSFATDDVTTPYIIIGSFTSNDQRNKCDDVEDCAVVFQVISGHKQGGRKDVDTITDLIFNSKDLLKVELEVLSVPFAVMDVYKINDFDDVEQTATHKVYRRIVTLGHIITQLN